MSSEDPTAPETHEAEQQNAISRVANLPLVSSTYDMVSSAYASTKETHPYLRSVCDVAEKGVKTLTAAAVTGAQPLLTRLEPQIATANEYACKGLDKLEETLPILQQPSGKVVADTKELVSTKVTGAQGLVSSTVGGTVGIATGAAGLAKGALQGGVEMARSVVAGVGQMVATGVDALLGKSEDLVDHYLPMTDQELATLATAVEGFEAASVAQQKERRSYFVRLGSLSSKLRHRAYEQSLAKLREAKQGTQDTLAKLHQAIELMERSKQGADQEPEKLQQMYLEWNPEQTGSDGQAEPLAQPEVESRTLAAFRGLTQQLQRSCSVLAARARGLPSGVQDKVQLLRSTAEELRASFSGLRSVQEAPAALLAHSRQRLAGARGSAEEVVEYVARNVPLPWVVGPFAPRLVELPEELPARERTPKHDEGPSEGEAEP